MAVQLHLNYFYQKIVCWKLFELFTSAKKKLSRHWLYSEHYFMDSTCSSVILGCVPETTPNLSLCSHQIVSSVSNLDLRFVRPLLCKVIHACEPVFVESRWTLPKTLPPLSFLLQVQYQSCHCCPTKNIFSVTHLRPRWQSLGLWLGTLQCTVDSYDVDVSSEPDLAFLCQPNVLELRHFFVQPSNKTILFN